MNDIVINKIQSIQRCIARAREEYKKSGDSFGSDFTCQDAAVLNVLRACEQAIDLANHVIKSHKMGIPTSSSESFRLLANQMVISVELAENLERMVHFRNTVTHEYQRMNIQVLKNVIQFESNDLLEFALEVKKFMDADGS